MHPLRVPEGEEGKSFRLNYYPAELLRRRVFGHRLEGLQARIEPVPHAMSQAESTCGRILPNTCCRAASYQDR
jgi:hypothetical protein